MSRGISFLVVLIAGLNSSCNPDTLDTISFDIHNQHDRPIRVTFSDYKFRHYPPVDTTFVVGSNEVAIVFFNDGLVIREDRYIKNDTIRFCSEIKVYSDTMLSQKNLMLIKEWTYHESFHDMSYTTEISSNDF